MIEIALWVIVVVAAYWAGYAHGHRRGAGSRD